MSSPDNYLSRMYMESFQEHDKLLEVTRRQCYESFVNLVDICVSSIRNGGKIMFFGNGGSAGDAQHLATELTVRFNQDRMPIAAIALTTDTSALLATGNDLGFEQVFSRQIEALGKSADVAIGISTSGDSENIICAFKKAISMDIITAGLSGGSGGRMKGLAEPLIKIPSSNTARIQEMHILFGHLLCQAIEVQLGFVDASI